MRATVRSEAVLISITDRGPEVPPNYEFGDRPGHDLRNVDERLRKSYCSGNGFEIEENRLSRTAVTIRIRVGGGQ